MDETKLKRLVAALILVSAAADVLLTVYFLSNGVTIVYQNIYYLTIVLAAYFYKGRGVLLTIGLSAIYLLLSAIYSPHFDPMLQAVIRAVIFVAIAAIVAYLADRLDQERGRYQAIFSISQAGMMLVTRPEGKLVEANEKLTEIIGNVVRFNPVVAKFRASEMLGRVIADGQRLDRKEMEIDGDGRTCLVSGSAISEHLYIISLVDVTELKIARQEAERTKERKQPAGRKENSWPT